jgi:hypothetical protein
MQRHPYQRPGGPPPGGEGGGRRAKAAALAAAFVVVTAGLGGLTALGDDRDDGTGGAGGDAKASAGASGTATASPTAPGGSPWPGRSGRPTVPGWKVVVNPKWGTAFDVPPDWDVLPEDTLIGFEDSRVDYDDPENWGKVVIVMSGPAVLREDWCASDDDNDGRVEDTALAAAGTKGARGAEDTADIALSQVDQWVYGGYTQPDTRSIVRDETARPYTTRSGVKGSVARARSEDTPREGECASDGKAVTFGFRNAVGDFVAWSLHSARGVPDEVPDSTVMKILSTVRLHGRPEGARDGD